MSTQDSVETLAEIADGSTKVKEAKKLVTAYKNHLFANKKCDFCSGRGHRANKCATLSAMDAFAATEKTLKSAWGTHKGAYVVARVHRSMALGASRRAKYAK